MGSCGDNFLDTSRTSITSVLSNNNSIVYTTNQASTRQSMSISSVSGEEEDDDTKPLDKNHPMVVWDEQAKVKVSSKLSESNLTDEENISHFKPPPTATSQSQVLSPSSQLKTAGHVMSDPRDFLELNSKTPMENSPPPPLPSLPPPPLLSGEEIVLFSNQEQPAATTCQSDLVDDARKLVSESDAQEDLLEYSELCHSLPSVESREMVEEFDSLADMTDLGQIEDQADSDHNNEVKNEIFQVIDETQKSPILSSKSNLKLPHSPDIFRSSSSSVVPKSVDNEISEDNISSFPSPPVGAAKTEEQTKLSKRPNTLEESQNKSMTDKSHTTSEDGNTSSLGSSLVGQSVTSWLGTPGSVSCQSINTDPSPKTEGDYNNSKYVSSTEESSDYVSGDSCELGSSSLATVEAVPFPGFQNGNEDKINYLSDGNFWVEGPPLVPTSVLDDTADTSDCYHPPTMVKFSTSPVRIFSTYTDEEYDRSNDDIDPAAASAEYELEKRVEKMETFKVSLAKGENGLGLSILGMGVGVDTGVEKLGIFIKTITAGGAAAEDGRIQVNDQIISVDGSCLVGVTQAFAESVLRNTAGLVQLVMGREEEPGESEVAQLIRQSVQADREEEEGHDQADMENDCSESLSLSPSSSAEGELSMGEEQDSETSLPGYDHPVEQYNQHTDNVNHYGDVDISNESSGQDITAEQENLDSSASPDEDLPKTCPLEIQHFIEKSKVTAAKADDPEECCSYQDKYKKLLSKYEQAQEGMGQMTRNLSIVTEQLVSRDQLFSSHMARLREVFSQLEEQLHGTDQVAACQQSMQLLRRALEPRGALRRKPFLPTQQPAFPPSSLDLAIPPTLVLDTSLARDRVSLVHRATLPRRRAGCVSTSTAQPDLPESGLGLRTVEAEKRVVVTEFQDQLRKTLLKNTRTVTSECEGETESRTPPLSPNRASSLPSSPTISQFSSSSSLHSVPGSLDGLTELKREKKRMSGKSLWQKARRRLSSR